MIAEIKDKNGKPIVIGCVVKDMYGKYWWLSSIGEDDDGEIYCLCSDGGLVHPFYPPQKLERV